MAPFILVLGTEIQNIKIWSIKLIIKSIAQKVMAKYGFGRRFHDLEYFKVTFCFIFIEFDI